VETKIVIVIVFFFNNKTFFLCTGAEKNSRGHIQALEPYPARDAPFRVRDAGEAASTEGLPCERVTLLLKRTVWLQVRRFCIFLDVVADSNNDLRVAS
jgi:hypothetical protein